MGLLSREKKKEDIFNKFLPVGFVKNDENFYEETKKVLFLVYQEPVSFNNTELIEDSDYG